MAARLPPSLRPDLGYLQAFVLRSPSTFWGSLGRSLLQAPRLLLLLGLGAIIGAVADALLRQLVWSPLDRQGFGMAVWAWGASLLFVELCVLVVREASNLPWPGSEPTTTRVFLRLLAALALGGMIAVSPLPSLVAAMLQLAIAYPLFAWSLPSALRGVHTARWGLASLRARGAPASPGQLAATAGDLGRRIVVGRLERDAGGLVLHGEGTVARLSVDDTRSLIQVGVAPIAGEGPQALIAHAHVDDAGYRSAGVRLDGRGLPVWLVPAADLAAQVASVRRRLRLAALLDGAYVAAALVGGVAFAAYVTVGLVNGR